MNDPYSTLRVPRTASRDEIKKAFRTLAHLFHPDKPTGNAQKFSEIKQAYDLIKDAPAVIRNAPPQGSPGRRGGGIDWDNVQTAQMNWEDALRAFGSAMDDMLRRQQAYEEILRRAAKSDMFKQGKSFEIKFDQDGNPHIHYV